MKSIVKFLSEARTELLKVTWPTRNAAIMMTITVIAVAALFALYVTGVDLALTEAIKWVTSKATVSNSQTIDASNINLDDLNIKTTPVQK